MIALATPAEDRDVTIARLLSVGGELVLGAHCPGCGASGLGVCAGCRTAIAVRPVAVAGLPPGLPAVVAGGRYDGELRRLLLAAKERDALGAVPVLAERLAVALARLLLDRPELAAGGLLIVPVPTARAAAAERGLDLTSALARLAARRLRGTGLDVRASAGLRQVRRPADQADLGREGRLANLAGAFTAGRLPPGELLLVDDIVTTGATLVEAVRALRAAGREPFAVATVAATTRRITPS